MSNGKEFINGLIVKAPHPSAPDFVKGRISINRHNLMEWLVAKEEEWINIDINESKGGKWYAAVNTWKKPENPSQGHTEPNTSAVDEIDPSDLPF